MAQVDELGLQQIAGTLADAVEAAIEGWVVRCVVQAAAADGRATDVSLVADAERAGAAARADVGRRVRALLVSDVDAQRSTPLALLREAVAHPTAVLRAAGVAPPRRDAFAQERFPDDPYGLSPASLADVDPSLAEPGLRWGAAKAWCHRQRHAEAPR